MAASIADGIEYLTGQRVDIDVMVTSVYGPNWHGGTSASRYVEYCAGWGVHLFPIDGPPATLVADLHTEIRAGHPCLLTEPDVYAPAHPDWSHVLSVYGETPGMLIARDPYSTKDVTHPDSTWTQLLEYREIWVMELLDMVKPLSITDPAVAALFVQHDVDHWQSKKTGCILQYGLLRDYIANGAVSLDRLGDVVQNEQQLGPNKVMQRYELGIRCWDNNKVYSLPLYDGPGVDPLVAKLEAQITTMQGQPAAPQEHAVIEQMKALLNTIP